MRENNFNLHSGIKCLLINAEGTLILKTEWRHLADHNCHFSDWKNIFRRHFWQSSI